MARQSPSKSRAPGPQPPDGDNRTWVTLKEASARAGVSLSWLRKQYRQKGLPTVEVPGPRGLQKTVPLEDVLERAAPFALAPEPTEQPSEAHGGHMTGTVSLALADLSDLLERFSRADRDRELLDRLLEVEDRAARAEAEADYLRLRLEDAFAEIERLRHQLAVLLEPPGVAPA
jgi:hypothetical protein